MSVNLDLVPLREASMGPPRYWPPSRRSGCCSSSPRRTCRWCCRSAPVGECWPPRSVRSSRPRPTAAGCGSGGAARSWSTYRPDRCADDGPVYARPMREPFDRTVGRPTGPRRCPGRATGDDLRATVLRMAASPNLCDKTWVTEQYDRYVLGQHRAGPAGGRRRAAHRRGYRTRDRALGRRQRPVRPARPVRRRAAGPGRGVPQRGHHRRHPDRRDQLPQLRLARGPGRDVAVRGGRARAGRRLPGTGHPGHGRQRQLLQPDRRHADQPDPGGRRTRPDR